MTFILIVLVLGLVNWFATTLIVDSEFFRPLREWVDKRAATAPGFNKAKVEAAALDQLGVDLRHPPVQSIIDREGGPLAYNLWITSEVSRLIRENRSWRHRFVKTFWNKAHYLVGCHMCTGTWVGFALAAFVPTGLIIGGVWPVAGFVINALAFKAVGHLVLAWVNGRNARIDLDKADAVAREKEGRAATGDQDTDAGDLSALLSSLSGGGSPPPPRGGGLAPFNPSDFQ